MTIQEKVEKLRSIALFVETANGVPQYNKAKAMLKEYEAELEAEGILQECREISWAMGHPQSICV